MALLLLGPGSCRSFFWSLGLHRDQAGSRLVLLGRLYYLDLVLVLLSMLLLAQLLLLGPGCCRSFFWSLGLLRDQAGSRLVLRVFIRSEY